MVAQCREEQSQQDLAAKITPYRAEQRQLVLREYQVLKRLNHPHLVQLYSALISPDYLVLLEELCAGRELLYNLAERQATNKKTPRLTAVSFLLHKRQQTATHTCYIWRRHRTHTHTHTQA